MQEEKALAEIVRILRDLELLEGLPDLHEGQVPAPAVIRFLPDRSLDGVLVRIHAVGGCREHFNAAGSERELAFKAVAEILAVRDAFQ